MWKLFQMLRIRFWGLFIAGLVTAFASASIGGYADLDTIKNEQQFTSSQSRFQQIQPHGQPQLKINSEGDMSQKKGQSSNSKDIKDRQYQFSETNNAKPSENKPDQNNKPEQSMKLNQLKTQSKRSNSMEITQNSMQALTNKKTGNNLRISQTQDMQQKSSIQNIGQGNSFLNSSNSKKEKPKVFKANVKVASKLPTIVNITHRKNKVDWINQHEIKNENNSFTNDKVETENDGKVHSKHINKYNVAKEIEQISSHLSKPIQHISATKFLYEFGFEYPMLSQGQNSKIFNQPIDQFSSPIELSLGSAFQNRLKSQFVVLSKQIQSIQRHLKLKPGSYKIEFEWQSNQPNGELIVFWNHRIVGSYKSVDALKKEEIIHVESTQECFGGDNILKFRSVGPIQIGIDNIQVIN